MSITFNTGYLDNFISHKDWEAIRPKVAEAHQLLHDHDGEGNDFLGWMTLPTDYDKTEFSRIQKAAAKIRAGSEILIVIGIGGSYLGARAAIELLRSPLYNDLKKDTPDIYFVGNSIQPAYLNDVISICEGRDFSVNVISKSGTTTEPAVAFRVFRDMLERKYGKAGARERIFATTDRHKGTLKELSDREGYETFVVPDDVGGRYSVLSAVGLLPIAVAGLDIQKIMDGAAIAQRALADPDMEKNACYKYAACRNILYGKGKSIEMFVCYNPAFAMMNEWLKQLFGESEGKEHKGLYPSSAIFSTDLHSMGQYIQEGSRIMFETVIHAQRPTLDYTVPDGEDFDGLGFLAGKPLSFINDQAYQATVLAHTEGGVPNLVLEMEKMDETAFGYMVYFFEKACALSGYILGVNPFNQPGVESYKNIMYALLGKPGYERLKEEFIQKIR